MWALFIHSAAVREPLRFGNQPEARELVPDRTERFLAPPVSDEVLGDLKLTQTPKACLTTDCRLRRDPAAVEKEPSLEPSPSPSPSPTPTLRVSTQSGEGFGFGEAKSNRKARNAGRKPTWLGIDKSGDRTQFSILCDVTSDCAFVDHLAAEIKQNAERTIENLYHGQQPDLNGGVATDASTYVPICNRDSDAENTTNHLGQSCGSQVCSLSRTSKGGLVFNAKNCEKERAWSRGALIHDIQSALADVIDDLQNNHHVSVGTRCNSLLRTPEFPNMVGSFNALYAQIQQAQNDDPTVCDISADVPFDDPLSKTGFYINDRRIPIQQGCQMNAANSASWSSVGQIALCEVYARADSKWQSVDYPRAVSVIQRTIDQAQKGCPDHSVTCLNQHYRSKISAEWGSTEKIPPSAGVQVDLTCPKGAVDCETPGDNAILSGTGSALSRSELASLNRALQYGYIVRDALKTIGSYASSTRTLDRDGGWGAQYGCKASAPIPDPAR